ncbi:MAG: ATP-binding protein [Candidatus Magnetomorum sp.]|nr:ATP-binding protein [Candidatus Magnetomorum sp.]
MNKKIKLIWQLYPSYLFIILLSLAAVGWYSLSALKTFYIDQTVTYLKNQGHLLEHEITKYISPLNTEYIDKMCKDIGKDADVRVTIMFPNGDIIGDSNESPVEMDNHADRPEMITASGGNVGTSIRFSRTLQQNMMYVAIPLKKNNKTLIVIRTSIPLTFIETSLKDVEIRICLGGLIIALVASLICLFLSRRISLRLEDIKKGAEQFAKGDFSLKIHTPRTKELASLTDAMNQMAVQLEDRIKTVLHQQNEIEAILTSMLEGVIAVNQEEQIIKINQAAIQMLDNRSTSKDYLGRHIQEKIRHTVVYEFIRETLLKGKIKQGDIELNGKEKQIFNMCCTPLCDAFHTSIGALVVFNDVTQLRHLENVRQDFVANVSHEIRTPLTTIKGFVETLLSGAMKNPDETERFLNIINKHVLRLTSITEDLLQLARLEQHDTKKRIACEKENIREVILSAIHVCQLEANNKQIKINLSCDETLFFEINSALVEHAIVNLLDNAVKYSENNSDIDIDAKQENNQLTIRIKDYGPGIAKEHLTRIFERFYRVDKARSRKLGGTGLGLSIARHIAQAHGGKICVESSPGKGSLFIISFNYQNCGILHIL